MCEKVSIIMPTYNCGKYIAEAVASVVNQTYGNWELWIVDDCSTDDTKQVLLDFLKDSRIRYHCLEQKGGPAAARNYALQRVDGEYVAFLDSDDLWHPEKLEKQLEFMKSRKDENCWFSCSAYSKIDSAGNSLHKILIPPAKAGYWKLFFLSDPIGNSTVMYERKYFPTARAPLIPKRNDYGLWLQMLRTGAVCFGMEESLMKCRIRQDSISYHKLRLYRHQWNLYRNVEKMNLPLCVLGLLCWAVVKGTGLGLNIKKPE